MAGTDEITVTLTKTEALALSRVADTGIRISDALNLIQSTAAAKAAVRKLDAAVMATPKKPARGRA